MSESKLAHVSYKCGKRFVEVASQNSLESLRSNFKLKFADVVPSDEEIWFQVFVKSAEDYIDVLTEEDIKKGLGNGEILKIKAFVRHKEEGIEQMLPCSVHLCCGDHCDTDHELCGHDWKKCIIPMCTISVGSRQHPIETKPSIRYEVWSPVSRQAGSLLKRENSVITAIGTSGDKNCEIQALHAGPPDVVRFNFVFNEDKKQYAFTVPKDLDGPLQAQLLDKDDMSQEFEAEYSYIYTVLRSAMYKDRYVTVDHDGIVTLKKMISLNYPDPEALLLFHKVKS